MSEHGASIDDIAEHLQRTFGNAKIAYADLTHEGKTFWLDHARTLLDMTKRPKAPVEVLHVRDPDSACSITVWVDGEELNTNIDVDVEDIDPGAGYTREGWLENIEQARTSTTRTPDFKDACVRELEGTDSDFITGD